MPSLETRLLWGALLLPAILLTQGCGPSLDKLNKLAATGSMDENAPVIARVEIEIAAPPAKVWKLLIDASAWPTWQKQIESVSASGPLRFGASFTWKTGGTTIHSQVQLFDPERRLAWTGTALTAKAVHVWTIAPQPANRTIVSVKESMDGPWMATIYPSKELAAGDKGWLISLKHTSERDRVP